MHQVCRCCLAMYKKNVSQLKKKAKLKTLAKVITINCELNMAFGEKKNLVKLFHL